MEPTTTNGSEPKLKMISGAFYIPKQRKDNLLGQDALFICDDKQTIGVADGVGGWDREGIDAGIYARNLISNFVFSLQKYDTMENNQDIDPLNILENAYSKTEDKGSSTACILTLKNNNSLLSVNVGDSGFMVLRAGVELYKSPVQMHGNRPYQLGKLSEKPSAAQVSSLRVLAGDIVVLGTDGLFDNLFTHDIKDIVNNTAGAGPDQVARAIAEHAYFKTIDKSSHTPFSEACFKHRKLWCGGKKDDISVIVSFILNASPGASPCYEYEAADGVCDMCWESY